MRALDTNVLVRLLTGDDAEMRDRSVRLLEEAEIAGEPLIVPLLVLLELLWVLRSRYGYQRGDILAAVKSLMAVRGLQFEGAKCVREFTRAAADTALDLPDILIGLSAHHQGCQTTLTFDRRAAASKWFAEVPL